MRRNVSGAWGTVCMCQPAISKILLPRREDGERAALLGTPARPSDLSQHTLFAPCRRVAVSESNRGDMCQENTARYYRAVGALGSVQWVLMIRGPALRTGWPVN